MKKDDRFLDGIVKFPEFSFGEVRTPENGGEFFQSYHVSILIVAVRNDALREAKKEKTDAGRVRLRAAILIVIVPWPGMSRSFSLRSASVIQ